MKNIFRSIFVLALVAGSFALTASAQKPTLVRNDAEPGRTPYQQSISFPQNSVNCINSDSCDLTFPAVPAGYRLVITHASGTFRLADNDGAPFAGLYSSGNPNGPSLYLHASTVNATDPQCIVDSPVTFFVEPGASPVFAVHGLPLTLNGAQSQLTIVGYLVAIP